MLFQKFAGTLDILEKESSRNNKTEILSTLLKELSHDEIPLALYLIDGRIGPRYESLEFSMSTKIVLKAIQKSFGNGDVLEEYKEIGDTGLVIEKFTPSDQKSDFDIVKVYSLLRQMAEFSGKGSAEMKLTALNSLFKQLDSVSNKFIARIVVGKVRLGLNDKTVLDATSWAIAGDKSLRDELERAYGVRSDIGLIVQSALTNGIDSLVTTKIMPGVPVASKLVEREKDTLSIFDRLESVVIQPKYDGLRAQIHFNFDGFSHPSEIETDQKIFHNGDKSMVRIYSRNMEDMTEMFPDVVQKLSNLKGGSFVLDSEVIGFDEKEDRFYSFQDTISRKRKHDVQGKAAEIPVRVFSFDLLYIDGVDITKEPLSIRIKKLEELIKKINVSDIVLTDTTFVDTAEMLEEKFMGYINSGLEGIIAKDEESFYKPGTRNYDWIKLKASSKKGFVDTVDAVILGYYKGRGDRARFGIGAILVGIYDDEKEMFGSLAKIGTGVTDEQWMMIKNELKGIEISDKPQNVEVDKILTPDVWVRPEVVMEVEADEITLSKVHTAGRDSNNEKGFSLRFPRMKVFRKDKDPEQSTSVKEIRKMIQLKKDKFS